MSLRSAKFTWPARDATGEQVLRWGLEQFGRQLAICTSFQATGSVILDIASRIVGSDVTVISVDTGRLHESTYTLISEYRRRYGITVELITPNAEELGAMLTEHGPNLFREDRARRRLCCEIRKVRPLKRRLATLDAWVTGLRRDQSSTRDRVEKVAVDEEHGGILKLSPLADWSRDQIFEYAHAHDVPLHPLYAEGYATIGCQPCTRPASGELNNSRSGRWWWEDGDDKECGMHVSPTGRVRGEFDLLLDEVLPARRPYLARQTASSRLSHTI